MKAAPAFAVIEMDEEGIEMMRKGFILFFLLCINAMAQKSDSTFAITYISNQSIYIDAGRANGVEIGDSVAVVRDGRQIAMLIVKFAAEHTAATLLAHRVSELTTGDLVELLVNHSTKAIPERNPEKRRRSAIRRTAAPGKRGAKSQVVGSIALQWRHSRYSRGQSRTFDQPGLSLNLRARHLFGGAYELAIRGQSRLNRRSYPFGERIPREEWRHRLYTFSFAYTAQNAFVNYRIGRVISNAISGVGYIDGVLLQGNFSPKWRVGGFAGAQPDWQDFAFQKELKKYGVFVRFAGGEPRQNRFESTLALTGEYHLAAVSREFLFMTNSYVKRRISFYQSAEIDLNRDWRKARAGESASLTNMYFHVNGQITSKLIAGLSYDNRKNYYTYELRSIADSLFDRAMRYGVRGHVNLLLPQQINLYMNGGIRIRQGAAQNSYSLAFGARRNNFSRWNVFADVNASGIFNSFLRGGYFSMRMGKYYAHGNSLNLSYGGFYYTMPGAQGLRTTQWLRCNAYVNLSTHIYCRPFFEFDFGDDAPGQQLFVDLGYRL